MKKNLIKRTLTIIALALSVVSNAVADAYTMPKLADNGKTIDIYLNLDGTETSPLSITDITADRILSDLGSGATTPLEDNIYLRWYIFNYENNEVVNYSNWDDGSYGALNFAAERGVHPCEPGWYSNSQYPDYITRWYSGKYSSSNQEQNGSALSTALKPMLYKYNNNLKYIDKNFEIICEIANKQVKSSTITNYVSSDENNIGFFQLRYVIHFGKDPNGFVGKDDNCQTIPLTVKENGNEGAITTPECKRDESTNLYTAGISLSKDANALSGGVTYARWYVADASGKELSATISNNTIKTTTGVTVTLPTGVTYQTPAKDATNSQYWFSPKADTDAINDVSISGNYAALSGCKVICVMSNATPGEGDFKLSDDKTTVTEEPDWDLKYEINFSGLPFVQPALASDGKTIHVYLDLADDATTSPLELSSVLSNSEFTKQKVQNAASGLISNLDQSYARIYMLDKNNSIVPLNLYTGSTPSSGWAISFSNNSFSPFGSGSTSSDAYSDNIYRYYYNKQKDQWNKLTSIPEEFFLGSSTKLACASDITPSKSGNTIVFEFADNSNATDNAITDYKGAKDNADDFYKLRYVLHFNDEFSATNKDDEISYKSGDASVILNSDIYKEESKPFYVTSNSSDSPTNIKSISIDLSKVNDAETLGINNGVKYARWYFVDNTTGLTVPAPSGINIHFGEGVTSNTITKNGQTQSYYVYSADKASTEGLSITVSDGSVSSIKDYKLVCAMSTNGSGAILKDGSSTELSHEPDWDVKYVISFVEENEGFPATNRKDATSYTSKSTVVSLGKDTDAFKYSESDGTGTLTINLSKDKNVQDAELSSGVKYIRWFFLDADGNIATSTGLTVKAANSVTLTQKDKYGYYWYAGSNRSAETSAMDGITISGSKENLLKYTLACVMSNDDYYANVSSGTLLHEPDWGMYYKMSLAEYVEFKHYNGYAYSKNDNAKKEYWDIETKDGNGMKYQKVHEWDYDIYVKSGETVKLVLPFVHGGSQKTGKFDVLEPHGYLRWYDFNTDKKSEYITLPEGTILKTYSYGQVMYNAKYQTPDLEKDAQVTFAAPAGSWTGTDIACDVSRYIDGEATEDGTLLKEPTLSIRYIYHIRPAIDKANELKEALINNQHPYEYKGSVSLGVKTDGTGKTNLRTDLSNVAHYYFYPCTKSYQTQLQSSIYTESDFTTTTLIEATLVRWFVYNEKGQYCTEINEKLENGRMSVVSISNCNSNNNITTFKAGDKARIVAYATNGNDMCPVAYFNCIFNGGCEPRSIKKLSEERTNAWLKQNYTEVVHLSFDSEGGDTDYSAPTTASNNKTDNPSVWENRNYGFVYTGLYKYYDDAASDGNGYGGLTCMHGEYGIYKSANLANVSEQNKATDLIISTDAFGNKTTTKYNWYIGSPTLYDMTYMNSNGAQYGKFLYVDASDESRRIASAAFQANLCPGSQLVFTANVANYTYGSEPPQLIFNLYGANLNADGTYTRSEYPVHMFATGNFGTVDAAKSGEWQQVYVKIVVEPNKDIEDYDYFIAELDNYAASTEGADFAVDDVCLYTRNTKILATQDAPICQSDIDTAEKNNTTPKGKATFKMLHESLTAMFGTTDTWTKKSLRWRICESDGTVVTGIKGYDEGKNYGTLEILKTAPTDGSNEKYQTINGEVYFIIAQEIELVPGNYYVSVMLQNTTGEATGQDSDFPSSDDKSSLWGNPIDICSVYSDPFTIAQQGLSITDSNGNVIGDMVVDCSTGKAKTTTTDDKGNITETDGLNLGIALTVPDPINGGIMTIKSATYDWYLGSKSEFEAENGLASALTNFRAVYPTVATVGDASGDFTVDNKSTIETAVSNGKLVLGASKLEKTDVKPTGKKQSFYVMPLVQDYEYKYTITSNGTTATKTMSITLCTDPIELSLNVKTNGPTLNLGFKDVTYPSGNRSVRLGLGQHLTPMINDSYLLRLPIHSYTHKVEPTGDAFNLKEGNGTTGSNILYVNGSNDPTWTTALDGKTVTVGTVSSIDAKYAYLKFDKMSNSGLKFHEGYWYDVDFSFYDSGETPADGSFYCYGDVFLRLKVVPEYVTWTAKADENYGSTNWNNDENWTRSTKKELYKDGYIDYGTGDFSSLTQQKTYVPMKFTKVTVPYMSNFRYAYLAAQSYSTNGIMKETSLKNADNYLATDDIEYDIMVKMKRSKVTDDSDENGKPNTNDFDNEAFGCEKFYGNTCEQIYFKPEAELRQQQYLTYEKAWVEKELTSNQWYTLATPLQDTYAGDMYVPYNIKDVTVGRQETVAFTDINFSTPSYSRNNAPIYQRSWDRADSKMLMNDSGTLEEGDADIRYTDWESTSKTTANLVESNWSHVYNDMNVKYYDADATTPRYGFAIKVGNDTKGITTGTTKAMIRLPKADKKYSYYYANDQASSKNSGDLTKTGYGKLLMDKDNIYKAESNEYGSITQKLVNSSTDEGYANGIYLISNPYMKTLNMVKFFNMNPNLEKKFWIIRDGGVMAANATEVTQKSADGTTATDTYMPAIKPLESFFVKVASGATATSVMFNTNITTSTRDVDVAKTSISTGTSTTTASAQRYKSRSGMTVVPQQELTMTATNTAGRSTASVVVREDADNDFVDSEDVETLFDSNLASGPTLYTVAGTEAVTINTLQDIDIVPLGIVSSNDESVEMAINGVSTIGQQLWFFDTKTGIMTSLDDNTTVNMETNVHGRYYLTTRSNVTAIEKVEAEREVKAYSPAIHTLVVSALGSTINSVKVFSIDGRVIGEEQVNGESVTMTTISGVNVVKVEIAEGKTETLKVNVR